MTRGVVGNRQAVRVATFNILNGRSPTDEQVDVSRLSAAVARLDADVLALQEVDRNQPRSQYADLTAVAAEAMGAREHRFVAALSGSPGATWSAADGREQPDDAAYGIALLSRFPVTGWETVRLPPAPVRVPMWFHGSVLPVWVRDEPRVAVVAEVDTPDGPVTVAATHLSFLRFWNARQLRVLMRGLSTRPGPRLLMGDLNMTPPRPSRLTGLRPLATAPTFPADDPREQLDHVLATDGLAAPEWAALRLELSDHRALVVDLVRTDAAGALETTPEATPEGPLE